MLLKYVLSLILFFLFCSSVYAQSYDGVYISGPSNKSSQSVLDSFQRKNLPSKSNNPVNNTINKSRDQMIQEFIQQIVIQSVQETSRDVLERIISIQKIQLFPQIVYLSIQQVASEIFNQSHTLEIVRSAYDESMKKATEDLDSEKDPSFIQRGIKQKVDEILKPIEENFVFKKIVEHAIGQAQSQQRKVVVMQMAQRQAQLAAMQQQYYVMQQAVKKQYQAIVEQNMKKNALKFMGR